MNFFRKVFGSVFVGRCRARFGAWRARVNPYKRIARIELELNEIRRNLYYEMESAEVWLPKIMSLEDTLNYIIANRCSVSRFGDGEFELVDGRDMSFEKANSIMQGRLIEILANPISECLVCVPNIFGSLARYADENRIFWRRAALWMRPVLKKHLLSSKFSGGTQSAVLGDTQISRTYLGVVDKSIAPRIFELWKVLFGGKDILIVEGRYSRLGVGNDLVAGAKSIKRIWCPPLGAFAKYDEIRDTIIANANKDTLILLALGATATILAYDLAKAGYWAVDTGHLDVEYMWMKMGADRRVPIPGRYVNECSLGGREMKRVEGEESVNNVIAVVGA